MMLDRLVNIAPMSGQQPTYYVSFKSGAIQRWAARQVAEGKDHYTMTTTLWRRSELKGVPVGSSPVVAANSTYYFQDAENARTAARQFIEALRQLGVKL